MDQQNLNYGRDQNIFNQPESVTNLIIPALPSIELEKISPARRIINYIGALIFLIAILCWWLLLGLFAKCKFPFQEILRLILASFKGSTKGLNVLWKEIEQQYKKKVNTTKQDLEISDISLYEYNHFNKQRSEVWLLKKLIEILISGAKDRNQEIDKVLEILQKQEDCIFLILKQLRKEIDPDLDRMQEIWNKVKGPSIEIDYERINTVLNSLVYKFPVSSKPTQEQAENLLEELKRIILDNPHNINASRIETLRSVLQLLKWVSATGYSKSFEYEFKVDVDSVRKQKAIDLIVEQIIEVLKEMISNIPAEALESIELGIRRKWLTKFSIYGFNNRDLVVIELSLEIDWNRFNTWRNQSISDGMVRIQWGHKTATEIDKIVNQFNKLLQNAHLTSGWRVHLSPGFSEQEEEEILKILKMENSQISWDEQGIEAQEERIRVQDLSELGVGLYFKPRENKTYSQK